MNMFRGIYHKIFVSSITTIQNSKFSSDIWKSMSLISVSVAMSLNVSCLWLVIETYFYPGFTNFLKIDFIPEYKFNTLFSFLIWLYVPLHLFNWVSIIRNDRYKYLMTKYPEAKNKTISGIYFAVSWFGFFGYLIFELTQRK